LLLHCVDVTGKSTQATKKRMGLSSPTASIAVQQLQHHRDSEHIDWYWQRKQTRPQELSPQFCFEHICYIEALSSGADAECV